MCLLKGIINKNAAFKTVFHYLEIKKVATKITAKKSFGQLSGAQTPESWSKYTPFKTLEIFLNFVLKLEVQLHCLIKVLNEMQM